MDVYLFRHGESTANKDGTHSGWSPVDLTAEGRAQAARTRERVQDIAFDRLFVSDVTRARQTADILFPEVPRTYVTIIREINNTAMKGKNKDEMFERFGEKYLACREAFDYAPLGIDCESYAHLHARAGEFLRYLEKLEGAKRVAVVAHAGFIEAVAGNVLGIDKRPKMLICENASVSALRLDARGWRLLLWNLAPTLP